MRFTPLRRPPERRPPTAPASGGLGLVARLRAADADRLRRYDRYLRFYNGEHWDQPAESVNRTRLTLNYARGVVDKGVSYLLGRGVNVSVPGDEIAEAFLYRVAAENAQAALDLHAATNGAVLGDSVFKVTWDPLERRVRVANVDPLAFFADWADDGVRLRRVQLVYGLGAEEAAARFGTAFPEGGSATVLERWTTGAYSVWVDERLVHTGPNPYAGLIPFVHIPNLQPPNSCWGVSDLRDVIPLNQEINARLSDQSESIRFHADPPVIFRGVQEHSDLPVGPGTVWDVPSEAEVHLLEWRGNPPSVQAHVEMLFRALYEVAETPRTSFGDSGRLLSGVALETELRPLILRTLRRGVFWEAALRRRNGLVLSLARQFGLLPGTPDPTPDWTTRLIWPPLVPRDDAAEVRNNVSLVQAGLRSRLAALDALGAESPEDELRRIQQEGSVPAGAEGAAAGLPASGAGGAG